MITKIIMPKMSSNMSEGIIVDVMVQPGDEVEKGDELFTVETDKTTAGITAEQDGIVKLFDVVVPGNIFKVGDVMGYIQHGGESVPDEKILATANVVIEPQEESSRQTQSVPSRQLRSQLLDGGNPILATPAARFIAKSKGIDLHNVMGSGPEGRIRHTDVETLLRQDTKTKPVVVETTTPDANTFAFSQRQMRTSEVVTESWQNKPHVSLFVKVDASRLLEKKAMYDTQCFWDGGEKVSLTAMLVKLSADLLDAHPRMKARPHAKGYEVRERNNIGIAVASEKGLVVPVITDADKKSLRDINEESRMLVSKSHKGTLAPKDVADGSFTISNLGMYEVESFTSIILEDQSAILSVGAIQDMAIVKDKKIEICPVMTLTLNIDHRCVDGSHGAAFLSALKHKIEKV